MIALAIIGAFVALLIILLLCPVGVGLFYHNDFSVRIYFGAFHLEVFPSRKNKQDKKDSSNKRKKPTKDKKKAKPKLDDILKIAECVLNSLKKLILSLRVRKLNAAIVVSGSDAAVAALNYGKVCTAVSMGYATFDKILNEKNTDISVDLEYDSQTKVNVDLIIDAMLLKIIIIAIKALIIILPLLPDNKKGGAENERNKRNHRSHN